jgi:hypothetical protein
MLNILFYISAGSLTVLNLRMGWRQSLPLTVVDKTLAISAAITFLIWLALTFI